MYSYSMWRFRRHRQDISSMYEYSIYLNIDIIVVSRGHKSFLVVVARTQVHSLCSRDPGRRRS